MTSLETHSIQQRMEAGKLAPEVYRAMAAFDRSITLDPQLRELVKIRASQLNGCAYCIDLHTRDARAAGEDDRRLATLAGWHEAPFFTERERAALGLTDAVTRLGDHGVPDEVWDTAARHFEPPELAQLLWAIVAINAWNRIGVPTRLQPQP
jgi:AhpD family alkylhydroperoxidase